jgi:3-phosphoshikimate 1-carboxyvinyltransferase
MTIQLHKPQSSLRSDIFLPGSKSISNRVLMIKALSGSSFALENLSDSDDTRHLFDALEAIKTGSSHVIDIGHAGTDMRFLTAYLATREGASYELTGSERMQQRPIGELVSVLKMLGADISYKHKEGFPPLLIRGKRLEGGSTAIRGDISSQFISALLLIAPYFEKGLELELTGDIVSKPYIDMTTETMKLFGAQVSEEGNRISVKAVSYQDRQSAYMVESDWSAASYFYSIVALSPIGTSLSLQGLFGNSLQADAACSAIYQRFGVETTFGDNAIVISKMKEPLTGMMAYDFTDCPDIAQTLACTCAALQRPFHFTGLQTLKVKETDRILALKQELKKFGLKLEATEHSLSYDGNSVLSHEAVQIATYNDHRMAMSFAPLALVHDNISIEQAEVVSKSYPRFWDDLRNIGFVTKL